jgi:tetratricopeptide (TPR) repeat protein
LEQLTRAGELLPDDPTILEHLGDTHFKLGNLTEAREQWEKALSLSPDLDHLNDRLKQLD